MYSWYEISIPLLLVAATVWLLIGSPGNLSAFIAVLSPFTLASNLAKFIKRVSEDERYPWPVRAVAQVLVKVGAVLFVALVSLCFIGYFFRSAIPRLFH
jgi:hypothetical protein